MGNFHPFSQSHLKKNNPIRIVTLQGLPRLRILYTITSFSPSIGGAQTHAHNLAGQLIQDHTIQVLSHWDVNRNDWLNGTTIKAPSQARNYQIDGIPVHRLGFPLSQKLNIFPFSLAYYPLMDLCLPVLAKNIESHLEKLPDHYDIVHNFRIGREPISYASLNYARSKNIPFVFTPFHHPRWSGWLYRHYHELYRQADAVFTMTETEKKLLISFGVETQKIIVIGNGPVLAKNADPLRFRATYNLADYPIVLFLGQKYPYKGLQALLRSARFVWKEHPETRFVFIGPQTRYSEKLFSEEKDERLVEIGIVDLQTKTDALAACSLLCVPSLQESFGGVFTEAWSYSKPVIGGLTPAVAEVIDHQINGFLVSQNPQQIAEYILFLLSNPETATQMGEAGRAKVQTHFTWEKIAEKTEVVYQSLLRQGQF